LIYVIVEKMLALLNRSRAVITIYEPVAVMWMRNSSREGHSAIGKGRGMIRITASGMWVVTIFHVDVPVLPVTTSEQVWHTIHTNIIFFAIISRKEHHLVGVERALAINIGIIIKVHPTNCFVFAAAKIISGVKHWKLRWAPPFNQLIELVTFPILIAIFVKEYIMIWKYVTRIRIHLKCLSSSNF